MSTTTMVRPASAGTRGVSFARVLYSEWLKLVTVRSTFWTTAISLVLAAGIALLLGATYSTDGTAAAPGGGPGGGGGGAAVATSASDFALTGTTVSMTFIALIVGVLGVLSIGGEYASLQIRSSYTAVPHRSPALVAKGLVIGAWSFVLGLVVAFGGFGIIAALLGGKGLEVTFDGDTVGALLGAAWYLAIIGVFAVGLGAVVRASAAGISILTVLLFVAPTILTLIGALLQADWATDVSKVLLSAAGGDLFAAAGSAGLDLWAVVLTLVAWIAAVWVPALVLTTARDV